MNHLTTLVIGLLAASTQAYVPSAPIQWMSRVVMPKISAGPFRGSTAPQQLLIKDPPSKMSRDNVPYFTLNSDSSISLEGTDSCIEAASAKGGDAIRLNRCTGEPAQKWTWIPDSHGGSRIRLKDTDKCLDASIEGGFNGAPIVLWECEGKGAESWKFEEPVLFQKQGRYMVMNLFTLAGVAALSLGALVWQYTGPQKSAQRSGSVNPSLDMSVNAATECSHVAPAASTSAMARAPAPSMMAKSGKPLAPDGPFGDGKEPGTPGRWLGDQDQSKLVSEFENGRDYLFLQSPTPKTAVQPDLPNFFSKENFEGIGERIPPIWYISSITGIGSAVAIAALLSQNGGMDAPY